MSIQHILVPIDFSELSTKSLAVANKLASLYEANITPIHVHIPITEMDEPYTLGVSSTIYQDLEVLETNLKDRLREIAEEHIDRSSRAEPVIAFGNPAQSIVNHTADYDLVVMSSHGRTGFSRFLLGSVAEKVLRLSHVPVLIVEDETHISSFERILITTDFSDNSTSAFPLAVDFAKRAGSKLHLLHILSSDQTNREEMDPTVVDLRKKQLEELANEHFHEVKENLTQEVIVTDNSPHEAILEHVRSTPYNLLLMATVGRTGISYLMMGSTTAHLVRHVSTAVLSVNPRKAEGGDGDKA